MSYWNFNFTVKIYVTEESSVSWNILRRLIYILEGTMIAFNFDRKKIISRVKEIISP